MTHGNEDKIGDSFHEEHSHAISGHRASGGGPGGILIGAGVLLWIGAGALMSVPNLMPQYAWVFKHAAKHGITSGPLILIGLCLIGVGLVARAMKLRTDDQEESQQRLQFDQLASGLAFVREGLDESRAELTRVLEATDAVLQLAQNEQASAMAQNQQDAIFRMAASLDQMGAHLDQRLQAQQVQLKDSLQELSQSITAIQKEMKEHASSKPTAASAARIVGRTLELKNARSQGKGASMTERSPNPAGVSSGSEGSLGLLDTLDDYGAMHTKDAPGRMQSGSSDDHNLHILDDMDGPSAPLPRESASADGASWASRHMTPEPQDHISFEDPGEISTRDKLELLRALMDDVRVREALGGLTGVEG
jgi:hypothetical protein